MLVKEFKKQRLEMLSDEFYDELPENCELCGYPLDINLTLTELKCTNNMCKSKIMPRLKRIKEKLNIDVDIETIDVTDYMSILKYSKYKDFTLLEYLKLLELPIYSQSILDKYFCEVNDLREFYAMFDLEEILTDDNIYLSIINMFDALMQYKSVILSGIQYVNLIDYASTIYVKEADRDEAKKKEEQLGVHIGIDSSYYKYENVAAIRYETYKSGQ